MKLSRGKERVLAISDLQIPFEHPDALAFIKAVRSHVDPTVIINVGDEVDQYNMSRFDPDPDALSGGDELDLAVERLRDWHKAFPDMKICESNHTERVYKKAFFSGLPAAYLRTKAEWLQTPPGWEWANFWEMDDVRYEHGDAQGGMYAARNLAQRRRQSVVIGHHHAHGATFYLANDKSMIFGMNVGCLIDFNSFAFQYAKMSTFLPTLGCGIIIEGVPFFIPMLINDKGRWTGELVL